MFFDRIQALAHQNSINKGFWEEAETIETNGNKIALMHAELSEALEALRADNPPDDKIPEFTGAEAELADCVIRIMDLAGRRGWRIGDAIIAKMAFNATRPHKHGKKF
jgi:NTP pyrophosphatase (non-canonical NTP hydrolase)